ncbi:hypothetical protein [Paenibacillus sp. PL91]|uniref:hypothetical protein n=1 Tax=Paenibacillus sp. PL91 TaxID=2729538 RepID=UPI0016596215|nr:hypothetical protein [Paenibacillus sp. PL91]MBC9204644.1 hypothetical protein [Paenibacillus sp. PL91]
MRMLVRIDGYFHRVYITGAKCTKQELIQKYIQAKRLTSDIKDLPDVFCRLHSFEQLPFDKDEEVDFVIDTDTDRIYTPIYRTNGTR